MDRENIGKVPRCHVLVIYVVETSAVFKISAIVCSYNASDNWEGRKVTVVLIVKWNIPEVPYATLIMLSHISDWGISSISIASLIVTPATPHCINSQTEVAALIQTKYDWKRSKAGLLNHYLTNFLQQNASWEPQSPWDDTKVPTFCIPALEHILSPNLTLPFCKS
jgi:hypothetical protein